MIPYKLLGPYISVLKNQAIFHQQKPGKAGNGQGLCDRGGNNTKLKETSSKDFRNSNKIKDSFFNSMQFLFLGDGVSTGMITYLG